MSTLRAKVPFPMADNLYTHSCSADFRACPRKYEIAHVRGIRARRPALPLRFGTTGHMLLESHWLARQQGHQDPYAVAWELLPKQVAAHKDAEYVAFESYTPYEQGQLRTMFSTYVAIWAQTECTVIDVEAKFVTPLLHPETRATSSRFQRAGKIDLILRLADGRIAVVEHKLTSADVEPGSDYRRKLTLDHQVSMYYAGAISLGFRPDLVIYDVLKKFDEKPRKATPVDKRIYVTDRKTKVKRLKSSQREHDETPAEYEARLVKIAASDPLACIERVEVHRLPAERKRFALEVWNQAAVMAHTADNGLYYKNPDSCLRYGSPCEFFAHCSEGASLDDPTLFRKLKALHPELHEDDPPAVGTGG